MAPIPIIFSSEASDLISSARRRQTDLTDFQIPRLKSCKGPLSLQQQLAAELREDVEAFEQQVEELDLCIDDQRGEKNRRELKGIVGEFREALVSIRNDFRAALIFSKRTIDSQSKSRRDELLSSSAAQEKDGASANEKVTDDALMKANENVTEALRRTIALMQGELERSVLSTQMLDSSTTTLRSTSTMHDTLTNVMGTSRQLITALEKADWLDRILIIAAFVFFVLVVLVILKQRIVDRGLRIAFWWTRFLPDFSEDMELLATTEQKTVECAVSSKAPVVWESLALASTSGMVAAVTAVSVALASSSTPSFTTVTSSGEVGGTTSLLDTTYSTVMTTSPSPSPEPLVLVIPTTLDDLEGGGRDDRPPLDEL